MIQKLLATSICQTLFEAGYVAYFAGGWVRDFLRGMESHEVDIATSAPPTVIQELFPKTIPVGEAFGVIIIVLEGYQFEVATFRKDHPYHDGRHPDGVDFSTPEKDACRRDFTINGMFYDPLSEAIHDYVNGQEDLQQGVVRAIGDPKQRFAEDRLRMVRAVRFASRFGFKIEAETARAIQQFAPSLFPSVSMERIWQEFNKMAAHSNFDLALIELHKLGLLTIIFPNLHTIDIEKLVSAFPYFPPHCPTILYLLMLFPNATLNERLELCTYLKITNADKKLVTFFTHADSLFSQQATDRCMWAHFYAHPDSELIIKVHAAHLSPPDRGYFLDAHTARRAELQSHIKRIQARHPLVTSATLKKQGIKPGKKMGLLLKKAEEIGINNQIEDPEILLEHLKKTPLWD